MLFAHVSALGEWWRERRVLSEAQLRRYLKKRQQTSRRDGGALVQPVQPVHPLQSAEKQTVKALNESTPCRRHLNLPPPFAPSHWQATLQRPLRTPLRTKVVGSSTKREPNMAAVQLESTRIGTPTEDDSLVSSDTSFATAEGLSPVRECPTLALTPIVERLCRQLEPSLRQDIQKKDRFMAQSFLETTSTTVRERTLTEEQQALVDTLDTTLQERKRRTMDHTPLQDTTNTQTTVKRKLFGSGSKARRCLWKSSPELQKPNLRKSPQSQKENDSVLPGASLDHVVGEMTARVSVSDVQNKGSPVATEAVTPRRRNSVSVVPETPQSCIAYRTRLRTAVFNQTCRRIDASAKSGHQKGYLPCMSQETDSIGTYGYSQKCANCTQRDRAEAPQLGFREGPPVAGQSWSQEGTNAVLAQEPAWSV